MKLNTLLKQVRDCTVCCPHLPLGPNPVLQVHSKASILIVGQAPGKKAHTTGVAFNDASGQRLRRWMGVNEELFYNPEKIAILPMGFCYPGSGKSGDLAPRPECVITWRNQLLAQIPKIQLTLVIGQYAQQWHLQQSKKSNLTKTVMAWREYWPDIVPLPHPSPRNNIWLKRNPWFENEVTPILKQKVNQILQNHNYKLGITLIEAG